jgi:hypothetical protein
MVAPGEQPAALRAVGPLTRLDLRLSGRRALRYRESRRLQIAPTLGDDLAARTIAMAMAYNSLYYSSMLACGLTVWARLAETTVSWIVAGFAIAVAVAFILRGQIWQIRIGHDTGARLSRLYGRRIKCTATPNVPAIRRALRRNGIPETEWPLLPAKSSSRRVR